MILPLNPSRRYAAPSPNPKDLGRAGVGSHLGGGAAKYPKGEGGGGGPEKFLAKITEVKIGEYYRLSNN